MRRVMLHPTRRGNSTRQADKGRPYIATRNIIVTDGPFTETKELLGSRTWPKPRLPVDR